MSCPSCCPNCVAEPPSLADDSDTYALSNLLPAGTIQIDVLKHETCDHSHAEDGWHRFRGQALIQHLVNFRDNTTLCQGLDFLISHRFILATCRLGTLGSKLHVRLYIIPHDLLHVSGKLRVRSADVLKPARRSMRVLLPQISQDLGSWDGNDFAPPSPDAHPFIRDDGDNRTLAEIYGDLSSPVIEPSSNRRVNHLVKLTLAGEGPDGLRTNLYMYQRRSVAAMIRRELSLEDIPDPMYIPITGMKNRKTFYLQPATMEILWDRPMVAPTRGGVLCEELGTGKTIMILALVLATLDELSSPEESILESRPVLTPLAFRHFPSSDFETARTKALRGKDKNRFPHGPRVPSLVELLLHRVRVQPHEVRRYEEALEDRKLWRPLTANIPFYHAFTQDPVDNERPKRKKCDPGPQMLLLTAATVIVVPANLIGQWSREIHKHCYSLRVLILRSTTPMPGVKALASDYDIILLTYHRFSIEARKNNNVADLESLKPCRCPNYDGWRIPDCRCKDPPNISPLLQIRWKRLLIDEGHVAGTLSTNLTPFVKSLSVERLWIVTGTPTRNLLGLSFGQNTEALNSELDETEDESLSDFWESGSVPLDPVSTPKIPRKWTKYDREDLRKLAVMTTDFIGVPHFKKEANYFNTHITASLVGPEKPHLGVIQVLTQIMNMVMIRHRIEDVEKDIVLPPIKQESILLDMDPYAIKAYNCLQAGIVINAIDSERTDQDYFFHPKNRKDLLQVVENMSQLMFWSVDDELYGVPEIMRESEVHLKTALDRNVCPEDLKLLRDAFMHVRSAAEDPLWKAMQTHEDVPYRVFNMESTVFDAWSRIPGSRTTLFSHPAVGFMHPDRLVRMRKMVVGRPLISMDHMIEWGHAVAQKDREQRRLYEESLRTNPQKKDKCRKPESKTSGESSTRQPKAVRQAKKVTAGEKLKEIRQELEAALKRLDAIQNEESEDVDHTSAPHAPRSIRLCAVESDSPKARLLSSSPLARVRVGCSASTKLDYILNEILQYGPQEKFLIFSNSTLTLAHVAEGLELLQVKYLQFTTNVAPQVREQVVMTFETSETYRVFLMELKHGARGLNLVSASRVIFCEPVWQADVESQAIKRVHRIGQVRPISVKILAIRSTAEENMMARRNALKGVTQRLPDLLEEQGMRHFIEHPKFIIHKPTLLSTLDIPLIDLSNTETAVSQASTVTVTDEGSRPSTSHVGAREESNETASTGESPKKKKKMAVRFSD